MSTSELHPGPAAIPIRSALLRVWEPRQRVVLQYDTKTESVPLPSSVQSFGGNVEEAQVIISEEHLKSLDSELAPYPFDGLDKWKALTSMIGKRVLEEVLGSGRVDGMTSVEGEVDETDIIQREASRSLGSDGTSVGADFKRETASQDGEERAMRFVRFDLKRSWEKGSVGEEITRWSRDKSWLLGLVVKEQLDGGMPIAPCSR
jgi:A1 cistron-splicing factor AAR2